MINYTPIDELIHSIYTLDREGCKEQLLHLDSPKLDFTEEFLETMSTERLRHVLMAACLQAKKVG